MCVEMETMAVSQCYYSNVEGGVSQVTMSSWAVLLPYRATGKKERWAWIPVLMHGSCVIIQGPSTPYPSIIYSIPRLKYVDGIGCVDGVGATDIIYAFGRFCVGR